jgi:hypothetical protein
MEEKVDPKLCAECGFRGTILCSHPDGIYHPEDTEKMNKVWEKLAQRKEVGDDHRN